MSGHGHVTPNADGSKARCGGPGICTPCSKEKAAQIVKRANEAAPPGDVLHEFMLVAHGEALRTHTPFGWFSDGWIAAISMILDHERVHGHEWIQAMGRPRGQCDDCGDPEAGALGEPTICQR